MEATMTSHGGRPTAPRVEAAAGSSGVFRERRPRTQAGHRRALILLALLAGCVVPHVSPVDQDLLRAAGSGDGPRVSAALEQGANSNASGERGWTPLMLAARTGDVATVTALLHHGAAVNATNDMGETALMVAHARVVPALLAAGAQLDARDQTGETAVMKATDAEKTRLLLAAGADANARSGTFGPAWGTALMQAVTAGDLARADALMAAGADVNADVGGYTVLMAAAGQGTPEAVRLLLQHGARVEPANRMGRTALHFAAANLRRGVVEAVLAAHPEINRRTSDGSTALLLAAKDGYTENVRALLAAGADPTIADATGQTPLAWATARKDDAMGALLRGGGATEAAQPSGDLDDLKRSARASRDGGLEVFSTDLLTSGQTGKIRGRIKNTYPERVEGIRYLVLLFKRDGQQPLDTFQYESETAIEPGGGAPMRLDVESMYWATEPRFVIGAFAKKVGDRELPPPPEWRSR